MKKLEHLLLPRIGKTGLRAVVLAGLLSVCPSLLAEMVQGTARVTEVAALTGTPSFLSAAPVVNDTATFVITFTDDFGTDVQPSPVVGTYVHTGVSKFTIDFGPKGVFDSTLQAIGVASTIDSWTATSNTLPPVGGEIWEAHVGFIASSVDPFSDDLLRTTIDAAAFLADPPTDTIFFEDRRLSAGNFTMQIETATSVPEPSPLITLGFLFLLCGYSLRSRCRRV